jgi:quercetin dioxygenase-like cupin family protein
MGRVVDFSRLASSAPTSGVGVAPFTGGEMRELAAEHIRIAAGGRWTSSVPAGSDRYLFSIGGNAAISAGSDRREMPMQSFATLSEGVAYTVTAGDSPVEIVAVTAPPADGARKLAGFTGTLAVAERRREAVVSVPEQRKTRVYFCGHQHGAHTERGHAMIVGYEAGTETALHHHPNAESIFVMLDGACRFIVDGTPVVVSPGQAACFATNDRHGLTTAPGHTSASFLEFHIPAAFTTVKT